MTRKLTFLTALFFMMIAACSKSKSDGSPALDSDFFEATTFTPRITVTDAEGAPLQGATLTFGEGKSAATDNTGLASLPAQARDANTVVKVTADGFAPAVRALTINNAYTPLQVVLEPIQKFSFNSEVGSRLSFGNVTVLMPSRGYVKTDGTAYSGPVNVSARSLDSGDELEWTQQGDTRVPLEFEGGIYLDMSAADGSKLSLAAGESALISIRLPTDTTATVGATLPVWTLDETTNLWKETSSCTVSLAARPEGAQMLECTGNVEHFSSHKTGTPGVSTIYCADVTLQGKFSSSFSSVGFFGETKVTKLGDSSLRLEVAIARKATSLVFFIDQSPNPIPRIQFLQIPKEIRNAWAKGTCIELTVEEKAGVLVLTQDTTPPEPDNDGDGYKASLDCNDDNKDIHPDAKPRLCSGVDYDCKDGVDRPSEMTPTVWNEVCKTAQDTWCKDKAVAGPEKPGNDYDENCDGVVADRDNDSFFATAGLSKDKFDCDDFNKDAHPGGTEKPGNRVDENCDGILSDADNDTYPSTKEIAFDKKARSLTGVDCNDLDPSVHPGTTDLPLIAAFYDGSKRKAEFCELFDSKGVETEKMKALLYRADRNCDGILEDLDGDGLRARVAGPFANKPAAAAPFYDANDIDPRIKSKGQTAADNASTCTAGLDNYGGGVRESCPRIFNQPQTAVETIDKNGKKTGVWVCVALDWKSYVLAPDPFAFGGRYGPCGTTLPACGTDLYCAGPITYSPAYIAQLAKDPSPYNVQNQLTGFCMPVTEDQ